MPTQSREVRLKSRPTGMPGPEHFELADAELSDPREGEILVRNVWMSVDPYMRGRMTDAPSYIPPFQIGAALEGAAVGIVERTADASFAVGDLVSHFKGWREYALMLASEAAQIDAREVAPQTYLGPLGVPGQTAFVGLTRIAEAQSGDTVFVTAAAGAVGSMACQIARHLGCRVVGSTGSPEKAAWLREELGVDAVINYREADNFAAALAEACPDGLDVCFDNVGGPQLEAAIAVARDHARFALCGMIGQYNDETRPAGPSNIFQVVTKRLALKGFIILDHADIADEFQRRMRGWIADGSIRWRDTVVDGLEAAPEAFLGLFSGDNVGKMLVKLGEASSSDGPTS